MSHQEIDALARRVGTEATRRGAVRLLTGGLGTVVAAHAAESVAAKKKRKKKSVRCNALPAQAACDDSAECCPGSTNRICGHNYCGETLDPVCCGGVGAACTQDCDCCGELYCSGSGKCIFGLG